MELEMPHMMLFCGTGDWVKVKVVVKYKVKYYDYYLLIT